MLCKWGSSGCDFVYIVHRNLYSNSGIVEIVIFFFIKIWGICICIDTKEYKNL